MKALIYDVETTTHMKGNPFSTKNKAVVFGFITYDGDRILIWADEPDFQQKIQKLVDEHDWIVGANIKFDIHWLLRYNINVDEKKLWDVLLYRYCEVFQKQRYISLNDCCEAYGFPVKLDVVKLEYWSKGIDTDQIPRDILAKYLMQDLECTVNVFNHQLKKRPPWFTTFRLDCLDLWSVIEMEKNGVLCDVDGTLQELKRQETKRTELERSIKAQLSPDFDPNLASNDQLSVLLYGGVITEEVKMPIGYFKTGARAGQVKMQKVCIDHKFDRRYEPPDGSELKKDKKDADGNVIHKYYSTSEDILRTIKAKKSERKVLDDLIELAKLDKLIGSYLEKIPKMIQDYCWDGNYIHGTFNHGVTITGRLASEKPNLQNMHPVMQRHLVSRFPECGAES